MSPWIGLCIGFVVFEVAGLAAEAVPPQVANLRVNQRTGSFFVDVYYDVIDTDSDQVWVGLEISADGGATYSVPVKDLSGDAGVVAPGRNRHMVWNAWNDWAGNYTTRARARVTVDDMKSAVFPPPFPAPLSHYVWIPPGSFTMGSPANEVDRTDPEGPQTQVYISRGFFLSKHETTQEEYVTVIGTNPSYFTGDLKRPVEQVTWYAAVNYCTALTQHQREAGRLPTGWEYRLPTEAQWEYACRAGSTTRFSYGDDPGYADLSRYAWFSGNSGNTTHPVVTRLSNRWGLFDMHGNVWEWCADWWVDRLPGGVVTDPTGPATGSYRVFRGGSWGVDGQDCRSAGRGCFDPSYYYFSFGFRAALVQVP